MRIGIDAMGGDNAPKAIIEGVLEFIKNSNDNIEFVLYGEEARIKSYLNGEKLDIVNCAQVIENDDKPVMEIRRKKDSSLVRGFRDLRDNYIDGFLSAGNTGAILVGGMFIVGRIEGIERPAITLTYPTVNGFSVLCDAGANADCKPQYLLKFAHMASLYAKEVLQIERPSIGLVNVGVEETKGNELALQTHKILKESNLNFIGNIEGRDIPLGKCDVIITDGFTGNIILKLTEGLAISFGQKIKALFKQNIFTKLSSIFFKKGFKEFKKSIDYREHGGAPILGVNSYLVKAHGSSDKKAISNAIKYLIRYINSGIIDEMRINE